MISDTDSRRSADPLIIAERLETAEQFGACGATPLEIAAQALENWPSADEFNAALEGLRLVRRAASDSGLPDEPLSARQQAEWNVLSSAAAIQLDVSPVEMDDCISSKATATNAGASSQLRFGRFQLIRELGRGGFGVVFLARDPDLGRFVAIKVLRADLLMDPNARRRFDREARLGSLLSHPNIVPIYESHFEGPIAHIVFAWCDGETLADWFNKIDRKASAELAAQLVMQLAQAVQYAHQRGVIHRDLKPNNILIAADKAALSTPSLLAASLQITDFGLARIAGEPSEGITRPGSIMGTPAYMSPEQASGQFEKLDVTTDVYSLGVLLYELLTGQPPFRKDSDLATLRAVECDLPLPPRRIRSDVPKDLQAICLKCLQKSPLQRYPSAFDLQADLERFLDGQLVRARHIRSWEKVVRWCRRNPALTAALAAVSVALALAVWQLWRAQHHYSRAAEFLAQSTMQRERAERNLDRAEFAIEQMLNEAASALTHVPRFSSVRSRLLLHALELQQQLTDEESDDPQIRFRTAQSYRRMAEIWQLMGNFDQALGAGKKAVVILASQRGQLDDLELGVEQARLAYVTASIQARLNQLEAALVSAQSACDGWSRVYSVRPDGTTFMELMRAMRLNGMVHESIGQLDQATRIWNDALKILDSSAFEDRDSLLKIEQGQLLNSLGVLYGKQHREDESELYFRDSLALLQPIAAMSPERLELGYNVSVTAFNLANRHHRRKEFAEANHLYQQAQQTIAGLVNSFPENTVYRRLSVNVASGLGSSLNQLGQSNEAADVLNSALKSEQLLPENLRSQPEMAQLRARLLNNLGSVHSVGLSDQNAARIAFSQAHEIYLALAALYPRDADYRRGVSLAEGNLAATWLKEGAWTEAESLFCSAIANGEAACDLDAEDASIQANVVWQMQHLNQVLLQRGGVDELLSSNLHYLQGAERYPARYLRGAELLAQCVARLDAHAELVEQRIESIGAVPDSLTPTDRERILLAGVDALETALKRGLLSQQEIANSSQFDPLRGHPRFEALISD